MGTVSTRPQAPGPRKVRVVANESAQVVAKWTAPNNRRLVGALAEATAKESLFP